MEQLLASCNRSTPTGRRDYAILLLLARLALRGGEVARLQLEDINWRSGEIRVLGKGQVTAEMRCSTFTLHSRRHELERKGADKNHAVWR